MTLKFLTICCEADSLTATALGITSTCVESTIVNDMVTQLDSLGY